ncbi:MAG TPA: hypothetical protein VHL09_12550 [Dehalococcoidia bacterium]|nr:hypothetical protein [Dehalococcoidia bacterium]
MDLGLWTLRFGRSMLDSTHTCHWDFHPAKLAQVSKGLTGWVPCADAGCERVVFFKKDWVPAKACEYVATRLAGAIGLPVPAIWLAEPASGYRGTYAERLPAETDWAEVARFVDSPDWCLPLTERFTNPEALAGMVAFDLWIGNADRSASNVMLRRRAGEQFEVFLIDHGEAADGGAWLYWPNPEDPAFVEAGRLPRFGKELAPALAELRGRPDAIRAWAPLIRSIPDHLIARLIAEVPALYFDEYDDDPGRPPRLERLLMGRRDRLDRLIDRWVTAKLEGQLSP